MKREKATELLRDLLHRTTTGGGWPLEIVEEVHVFGSYARGSLEPGDIDVAVTINRRSERWRKHFINSLATGRDPHTVLRVALRGRRRLISLLIDPGDTHSDMPMTLLWRRGESAEAAYLRLAAIEPDPAAGRAPRHGMHPCFEGIEDFVPRFIREELVDLESHGIIVMKQVVLDDVEPGDAVASAAVEDRWVEGSPLRRAALAALAHLTARGVDPSGVHLHGRDVERGVTPYFVGLKLRYLRGMVRCFREFEGVEWLEVVRPTLRGLSAAARNCPETATKLPGGGHENCPLTVMGSARHDVVCLAAFRGWGPFLGCDERC